MMIELGGGLLPHPRADVIIDLHHPRNAPVQDATMSGLLDTYWRVDPSHPLSAGDTGYVELASVDEVYASHFMEHVHRGEPLIRVMNEAWRVLRPGGTFTMVLPLVGWTEPQSGEGTLVAGWQPYADPTHVNYWWFPEALLYFCEGPFKPHADYGIRTWAPLGPVMDPTMVTLLLERERNRPVVGSVSWWTVRGDWEGVARLVKP